MRIGLLTLPFHTNYGGILQAYALKHVLEGMGHDVLLIERSKKQSSLLLLKHKVGFFVRSLIGETKSRSGFIRFVKSYFPDRIYPPYVCNEHQLDALIVGSDQVWRYWGNPIEFFYFDFARSWDIKRIAYAASFGVDDWRYNESQKQTCRKLISLFDKVSVREESAIDLCRNNLDVTPDLVLDPTLLLMKDDYLKIASPIPDHSPYINFILDENDYKSKLIHSVESKIGVQILAINHYSSSSSVKIPSLELWLSQMINAKFLITDSFHGAAFAINFNVNFAVIPNEEGGNSRIHTLLKLFNLENHMVNDADECLSLIKSSVDWTSVNNKRNSLRESSINFLKTI